MRNRISYRGASPSRPSPISVVRRHHPNRRPNPVPHRHPRLDLNLAIPDALTSSGVQPGRLDGVDDLSSGRVGNAPAIGELIGCAGPTEGEVDGIAVLDLTGFQDVSSEGRGDVEGVVFDPAGA